MVNNLQSLIAEVLYIFREGGQQFQLIWQKQTFNDRFLRSNKEFLYKENSKTSQVATKTCRLS